MSGLVDVATDIASSEETKAIAPVPETDTSDVPAIIPTIPSTEQEQNQQHLIQPREELEIVQKANDDEAIGDVVDQFDKAVTLNSQNTSSLQQIQAVPSHLSAGINLFFVLSIFLSLLSDFL
jgi:hypothetical protein